jgi:hypothetical protein
MQSVRDNAIAAQKFSLEFEDYNSSMPLVLTNTGLFLYDQVTNIWTRETSVVVTTLTGIPPHNTHSHTAHTLLLCCVFNYSIQYSATCEVLMVQVTYKLRTRRFSVLFRMLANGHSHNIYWYYGVGFGLDLCLSKSHRILRLITHFRSLNIKIDYYIAFLQIHHLNFPTNFSQYPHPLPKPPFTHSK